LNDSALASVSMGYQVGVTPLQMAAAASVVANGGTLYRAARRARDRQGRRSAPCRAKACAGDPSLRRQRR
jgi:membrane carboxypeptidase/penicillin-binding protein